MDSVPAVSAPRSLGVRALEHQRNYIPCLLLAKYFSIIKHVGTCLWTKCIERNKKNTRSNICVRNERKRTSFKEVGCLANCWAERRVKLESIVKIHCLEKNTPNANPHAKSEQMKQKKPSDQTRERDLFESISLYTFINIVCSSLHEWVCVCRIK